jgi:hypothetical protein
VLLVARVRGGGGDLGGNGALEVRHLLGALVDQEAELLDLRMRGAHGV